MFTPRAIGLAIRFGWDRQTCPALGHSREPPVAIRQNCRLAKRLPSRPGSDCLTVAYRTRVPLVGPKPPSLSSLTSVRKPSWGPYPRLLLAVVSWLSGYKWAFPPLPLFACRKGFRGTVSFWGGGGVSFFTGIVSAFTGTASGIRSSR